MPVPSRPPYPDLIGLNPTPEEIRANDRSVLRLENQRRSFAGFARGLDLIPRDRG